MMMEQKEKKKRRETWTLLNTAYEKKKKKKERTIYFLNRQYINWKKEEKKTEHFWTLIVILFWLVVKGNFLSLFEFKGDIRIFFFFMFILWNLTKTIKRGFYTRLNNNWHCIDSKSLFFLEFVFLWNRKYFFFGVSVFEKIGGWRENRTDIHPIGFRLLLGRRQRKQFYRRTRRPMKLFYFLVWSSEDWIKEKRRGLLQNCVDDVWVFQSRWCFGFVCDLAKWNESGKGEMPIYW